MRLWLQSPEEEAERYSKMILEMEKRAKMPRDPVTGLPQVGDACDVLHQRGLTAACNGHKQWVTVLCNADGRMQWLTGVCQVGCTSFHD